MTIPAGLARAETRRVSPDTIGAGREFDLAFCEAMLPRVSRTFALCIRLLSPRLARPVMVSYLLCRIADTIEDSDRLNREGKGRYLGVLSRSLDEGASEPAALAEPFDDPSGDEDLLVRNASRVWREYRALPAPERDAIRPWVQEMCGGMAEFARDARAPSEVQTLDTVQDLDRYCYYVAGTVGHLLTGLFNLHSGGMSKDRLSRLQGLATSFGLGLQLTNIVKDAAHDHQHGWSFVPGELCRRAGVAPAQLFDPRFRDASRQVMDSLIAEARGHLDDALAYTQLLPRRMYRARLFCLTSLFFAVRTLNLASRDRRLLDPGFRLKISRGEVYRILATTAAVAPSNALVRAYYRRLAANS